jgi:outer membrane protein
MLSFPRTLLGISLAAGVPGSAGGADVFNTQSQVSPGPATAMLDDADDPCRLRPLSTPLRLFDAIERSLCESPKTRSAWATVKAAAAGLGESKAAYLPTLDATVQTSESRDIGAISAPKGSNESGFNEVINAESLSLGWVLYDFGDRAAALRNSKELVVAAQANQNLVLQTALLSTAKDYYAAQAARGAVDALRRIESDAQQTLDAASARYRTGVGPITDQLQAQTASAQAVYELAKAEGLYQIALGTLAVDMSLSAEEPLSLPDLDQGVLPDTSFMTAIHDLIEDATQTHPSVLAARAQWQAALQSVREARAAGLPKLSLSADATRASQPISTSVGPLALPASTRQATIGLSIQMPLFQGFSQTYKIRQAEAVAQVQEQGLRDVQQQVALGVWTSVQTLQSDTENLHNTEIVLQSATDSFVAAEHRYQTGVGNILELLSAQTVLANAEQQRIQSQLEWRTARLQLAASLGHLGMWSIK